MPLALDPDERIELMLESDRSKSKEKQVKFFFRHLESRKFRELQRTMNEAFAATDAEKHDEEDAATTKALMLGLYDREIGKSLMQVPLEGLLDLLTVDEKWELLIEYRKSLVMSGAEKKASPSPLPSVTESSALDAATANVIPNQPSLSPSSSQADPVPFAKGLPASTAPTVEAGAKTS